ncbi:nucleotide pyrophosphohydrolase [Halobacterium sp. KA-6]|uniref:nucleotide pyrophosphohydrolase n=1 Tax=Halobacterium sp. KA-6 TaxID=2896368 RepID=UPI001E3E980F|nr:nucleotide pyrophosphohydrolase [Halobacterium sp. KA-6]MCD2204538.1 nucleotide pyrophosphohydrolase [Halobacterium sp. KA-6]
MSEGSLHLPKVLGIDRVTEPSELFDEFRFKNETEQLVLLEDLERGEVADVFFLLRFADLRDIDLEEAFERALVENRKFHPVKWCRKVNKKSASNADVGLLPEYCGFSRIGDSGFRG